MKKALFITLFVLLLFALCTNSQKESNITSDIIQGNSNGNFDRYIDLNEIVLFSNNTFLFYKHLSIDSLLVIWGNTKYNKVQYDTLPMFVIGPPRFEWSNNEVIYLRQGCGTDCFFAYILLFKTGEIKTYMYPLACDTTNNLIAYANDNYDSKVFLFVENFLTGEKREITEDYLPGPHSGDAIDSINFIQNGLFVKWRDSQDKIKEKIFK